MIEEEVFENVEAKIVVLPTDVAVIEEGTIDQDMLVAVPAGSNIVACAIELGLFYVLI